ncbi:MAG: insulinase family protein [Alphaproteobacteria bacterium]|jgi:zinc protease|nr:insulinase family protein [Alphaproteobacteria bacterium]
MSGRIGRGPFLGAALLLLCLAVLPTRSHAIEVQRVISPGGIEAWLVESHRVPVIAMEFAFRGGSSVDPEGREGLANLASTLLDEGAGDLDAAEFQQRLTDAAIDLSFGARADAFQGSLKTVTTHADEAFGLLQLALTAPRFDADAVERMRAAVLADIQRRVAEPDWLGRRAFYDVAYEGHPYGRPLRGTAATLAAITADDLRGFVADNLVRDRLVVAVTGDITPEALAGILDEVFGALPAGGPPVAVPDTRPGAAGMTVLVERSGAQSFMMLAQPGIGRDDPDFYAAYVLNHILGGGGFTSRLTQQVREERGLTYGIFSYLANFRHSDLMLVMSSLSNDNVGEALAVIRAIWRDVAENGVSEDELADAQTFLTGSFPLQFTSTERIAGYLRRVQLENLPIDHIDRRNDLVNAVTREAVARVAARLLDAEALTVVVVGDPEADLAPDLRVPAASLAARELNDGGS